MHGKKKKKKKQQLAEDENKLLQNEEIRNTKDLDLIKNKKRGMKALCFQETELI